jgi:hypothetical protein
MSYNATIQTEAQNADSIGPEATEEHFLDTYKAILAHWFPTSRGYTIDPVLYDLGDLEPIIVRRGGNNIILIVKLLPPSEWTADGREVIVDELANEIGSMFDITKSNTFYGLGGIGLHWMVCEVKSGNCLPTTVLDWQDNIASDASYTEFETIANLVYNLA